MHELRSPLDSLYDLRGEIELTFDAWTGRGSFRVRQDGVGRLSADVWFPRGEALGRLGSVAQIRGVTARLDDGRRVGFTAACPLVSRSQIATDHLRLTLRPSRILIGPYPRGAFVLRSYLTNVSTRGGGIETTVPGIGTIWHRAAPNTRQLQDNWLPTATPTVLGYSEFNAPSRLSFRRAQHLLTGYLLRLSLASGASVEPVAHEMTGAFGRAPHLIDSVARPAGVTPLLPDYHDSQFQRFEFAEVASAEYERLRSAFALDQTVRALSDVVRQDPPFIETRSLLIAALLESLTKAYATDRGHSWKSYRGGLNLMLQGIFAPSTTKRIKDTRTAMVHSVTTGADSRDYFVMLGALRLGLLKSLGFRGPIFHPWRLDTIMDFPPNQPL